MPWRFPVQSASESGQGRAGGLLPLVDGRYGEGRVVCRESVAGAHDGRDRLEGDLADRCVAWRERVAECERDRGLARLHRYRLGQDADHVEAALAVAPEELHLDCLGVAFV